MGRGPDLKPRKPRADHIAGQQMIPKGTADAVAKRIMGQSLANGQQLQRVDEASPPIVKALAKRKVTVDRVAARIARLGELSYKRAILADSTAKDITTAVTVWRNIAKLRGDWATDHGNGVNQPQIPPQIVVQLLQVLREDSSGYGDAMSGEVIEMGVGNASAGYAPTKNVATTVLDSPPLSPSAPCPDADNVG